MLAVRNDGLRLDSLFEFNPRTDPSAETHSPCRVLVVDDDEGMRLYLSAILQSASYNVEVAASASEALRLLLSERYDILVTDCQMPNMNGLSLCKHVRLEYPNMYVLMFTIKGSREDRRAGLNSGADEYVVKGAPKSEVLAQMDVGRRMTSTIHSLASCVVSSD